jgi:hypothetical protein
MVRVRSIPAILDDACMPIRHVCPVLHLGVYTYAHCTRRASYVCTERVTICMHVDGVARRHSAVLYWAFALDPGTGIRIIPSRLASYDQPTVVCRALWLPKHLCRYYWWWCLGFKSLHTVCSDPMVAKSKATYHSTS